MTHKKTAVPGVTVPEDMTSCFRLSLEEALDKFLDDVALSEIKVKLIEKWKNKKFGLPGICGGCTEIIPLREIYLVAELEKYLRGKGMHPIPANRCLYCYMEPRFGLILPERFDRKYPPRREFRSSDDSALAHYTRVIADN